MSDHLGDLFEPDIDPVEDWRLHQLIENGYPVDVAVELATRPWHDVDLHQAVELVARGCTPELASRILL